MRTSRLNATSANVSVLRRLFGESGASPHYIETVPKRGYRFIAEVVKIPEKFPGTESEVRAEPARAGTHNQQLDTASDLYKRVR